MKGRITLPQLKKYDINQRVIELLTDAESRSILLSLVRRGKTAADLSRDLKIPLSSVYKKLNELEEMTLIIVEKRQITDKGRRYKIYRSRISQADISIKRPDVRLVLIPNKGL